MFVKGSEITEGKGLAYSWSRMMLIKPTHNQSSVKCFFIGQYDFVYCWVDFSSCFVVFAALTNMLLRFSFRCRPVHRLWSPTSAWNGQCYQEIIKRWWVKCVLNSVDEGPLGNKSSPVTLCSVVRVPHDFQTLQSTAMQSNKQVLYLMGTLIS